MTETGTILVAERAEKGQNLPKGGHFPQQSERHGEKRQMSHEQWTGRQDQANRKGSAVGKKSCT